MPLALSTGLALPIAATANSAGTFSIYGSTIPIYPSATPSAKYHSGIGAVLATHQAWIDASRRHIISGWNPTSGEFLNWYDLGIAGAANDDHDVFAIDFQSNGRVHAFGGSHVGSMRHVVSAIDDISSWTTKTNPGITGAYPHPNIVGSDMFLLGASRDIANDDYTLKLRYGSIAANGDVTWGTLLTLIDPEVGGTLGDTINLGQVAKVGTELWLPMQSYLNDDAGRLHEYLVIYDTVTKGASNFAGDVTVAEGSFPITKTQLDASFRIYEHTGTNVGIDTPCLQVESGTNRPHLAFGVGPIEGPYTIKHMWHDDATWQTEDVISGIIGRFASIAMQIRSNNEIDLYYPVAIEPHDPWDGTPSPLDGHQNLTTRSSLGAGGTWSQGRRIITADGGFPIGRTTCIEGREGAWMFELADDRLDSVAGDKRGYMYDRATETFISRPSGVENRVAPSISGTANVGQALTIDPGEWFAHPQTNFVQPVGFTYQWLANGAEISGATNDTYVLTSGELGDMISCQVTGSNGITSAEVETAEVGPVGASDALLLDTFTTAIAAYSFRKLRTAYAGSAVRLRRSSDNAEQDIGFSGTDFDTAAAAAFIGAGTGFIKTWYDQSGNGDDITQTTNNIQPDYDADAINSKPAALWEATGGLEESLSSATNAISLGGTVLSSFFVGFLGTGADNFARAVSFLATGQSQDWNNSPSAAILIKNSNLEQVTTNRNGATALGTQTVTFGTPFRHAAIWDGTNLTTYKNGVAGTPVASSGTFGATGTLRIGDGESAFWRGAISEVILWAADQTSNKSGIDADQEAYWG